MQYKHCPISPESTATRQFGQLIEYSKINIYFKNHAENEAGTAVPDLLLFFKKGKSKWSAAWFHYISIALQLAYNNKLYKILRLLIQRYTQVWFLRKVWFPRRNRFLPHFVYISTKVFLMLCSINWSNLIAWLPLLLEILVNMCIAIVS